MTYQQWLADAAQALNQGNPTAHSKRFWYEYTRSEPAY